MCFFNLKTEDWKIIAKIIRLKISHSILQIQLVLIKQKNYFYTSNVVREEKNNISTRINSIIIISIEKIIDSN